MADPKAPEMHGWKPDQYGGFTRGNWDVDFDGEDVEASVNVSGYGGYGDRMCLPLPVLRALLSAHGLHIVSEAERKVLEALRGVDPWGLSDLSESNDCGDDLAGDLRKVIDAELARRSGT